MSEKQIYFQWQNEALLKSIYPLRTMNLRNALEYYQEIDLWRQFKGKSVADMPDEVAVYHEKMSAVVKQAEKDYEFQLNYFCEAAFQLETVPGVDENLFKKIQTLHDSFKKYYRTYEGDAFRQSYFITRRLEALDADRKELDKRVSGQLRYVNMLKAVAIPNEAKIKAQTEVLDKLRALQPVFTEQREHLVALLSAFGKLEAHKKDYNKRKKIAEQQKNKIDADLVPLQSKLESLEAKLKDVFDDVRRLARQLQPETDLVDNYFAVPDLVTNMTDRFPQTDPVFCAQVDVMREEIALLHSDEVKRARLNNHISTLQRSRALFAKRTDLTFKENTLKAFDEVLDQMKEYWFKLDNQGKTNDVLEKALKEKEQEGKKLEETFVQIKKTANELTAKFDDPELSILQVHEDLYIPIAPAMKDIIQLKLDEYIESTLKVKVKDKDGFKYQDKDQYQLLELLIERFKKEPARFPRWLQYMIVHFSGMRYASAHGSWADPRDLYLNLRISIINDELDKRNMDDFAVQEMCQKKIAEYTGEPGPDTVSGYELPKFAATEDKESKKKIQSNLTLLKKADAYSRRIGLLQLLLDEEAYENETMTEQEALEALETLKEEGHIPEWMWKELSAVTDLRLSEARDENWEKLTPEEQALKNDAKWSKYRGIMNDWKKNNLTGWREEHDRTNDLLVSRAVCNEVAEHILHLRGHKGFAGLSGAADWFLDEAKKADAAKKTDVAKTSDVAYFVKPQGAEDYRPGAGILWLRYRYDAPPPWNTVNPFAPNKGQSAEKAEFFPSKYFNSGNWNYTTKSGLFRSRSVTDDKGKSTKIGQYLYWVHIATVAEVVEVDSGETIVLTYETNLPYEDRRLACVGSFRRSLHNLLYDGGEEMFNGSLVGYVPDNPPDIPTADLDEMLDWDHILLK